MGAGGIVDLCIRILFLRCDKGFKMCMGRLAGVSGGIALSVWVLAQAGVAHAHIGLADPQGSGPIVGAVQWLQGTLLGTVATVLAVIAVACVGLLMLTGRINWRHGAVVILGCFILFGAVSIVAGIRSTAGFAG